MNKKMQSELDFWKQMHWRHTHKYTTEEEKRQRELSISKYISFPRYCEDLYVSADSFKGKRILDVGCGPHGCLIGFTDCEKYGVDSLIDEYVKIGFPLDIHDVNYYNAYSEELWFAEEFFDYVLCVNAIDHVDNVELTFKEMARVLKFGGFILGQFMLHEKPTLGHPICLDLEKVEDLCKRNSLTIEECKYQRSGTGKKEDIYFYRIKK